MNETHDCRKCRKYGTDYDCRENCEGRDMFEPIKKKTKKLIIEIDEDVKGIIDRNGTNEIVIETIWKAVKNGTSLEEEFKKIRAETIIDALEKLKAEFEEDKYILLNQITAIKVIDNHISELKGE